MCLWGLGEETSHSCQHHPLPRSDGKRDKPKNTFCKNLYFVQPSKPLEKLSLRKKVKKFLSKFGSS
jgi:hypothetical protein